MASTNAAYSGSRRAASRKDRVSFMDHGRRLRPRLFSAATQLITTARRQHLRFTHHWDWTDVITSAIERLDALANPVDQQIHLSRRA